MSEKNYLLPPNASTFERDLSRATARINDIPVPLTKLWRAWECPTELLPWLAWAMSVDDWQSDWPEEVQRKAIEVSLEMHRHKGTPYAVRLGLDRLGLGDVRVVEWFDNEPTRRPYTFRGEIDLNGPFAGQTWRDALRSVMLTKNARSHLESVRINSRIESPRPVIAPALVIGGRTRLYPPIITHTRNGGDASIGAAARTLHTTRLYPRRETCFARAIRTGSTVRLYPRRETCFAPAMRSAAATRIYPRRETATALFLRSVTKTTLYPRSLC